MKLNLDMVARELGREMTVQAYGAPCTELDLEGLRFFSGQTQLGQLYLMDGHWPPADFSGCALCRNPDGVWPGGDDCRLLAVYTSMELPALANCILEVFDRYNDWDRRLQQGVRDNLDLREIAGMAAELLDGRILVSDKKLHLLADSHFYKTNDLSQEDFQGQALPEHVVRAILSEALPDHEQGLQPYVTGRLGQYGSLVYCVDLCIGGRREATCALMEEGHPLPIFALPVFQHVIDYILSSFLFHQGTTGRTARPLRRLVEDLLQSDRPTESQKQEAEIYQKTYAGCRCAVIDPLPGQQYSLEYLRLLCEQAIEGCIAVLLGEQVAAIFPAEGASRQLRLPNLSQYPVAVGLSEPGGSLTDCFNLYRQAREALRLGRRREPDGRRFLYRDVQLEYLTETVLADVPAVMVRTAGFQRLLEHNAHASADYVETLRVWLDHEMHVTDSAAALYLHRSSFLKRLDKLQELLGEELQTPDGRLLLRLQLTLWE